MHSTCCDANPVGELDRYNFGRCRACGEVTDFEDHPGIPKKGEIIIFDTLGRWRCDGKWDLGTESLWSFTRIDGDDHDTVSIDGSLTGVPMIKALYKKAKETTMKRTKQLYSHFANGDFVEYVYLTEQQAEQLTQKGHTYRRGEE